MAETSGGLKTDDPELRQQIKDEELFSDILKVLGEVGHQRVLLIGKAGIGKTRLAMKVNELATKRKHCFVTLFLHLNKKFEDETSLYEYIASQLSVHSDFEETEVDDRDEDEEEQKVPNAYLDELKNKIVEEIATREEAAKKASDEEYAKIERQKTPNQVSDEMKARAHPYILLILDDEGTMTREDRVMKDLKLWEFLKEKVLKGRFFKDPISLKILVTRINKDEEPTKAGGEIESQDATSEKGSTKEDEAESNEASEMEDEAKSNEASEMEDEAKSNEASEVEEEAKSNEASEVDEESKSKQENDEEGEGNIDEGAESQGGDSKRTTETTAIPEITDGGNVPLTIGAESKLASKYYDEIEFPTTDKSEALLKLTSESNPMDLLVSLVPQDWKTENELISSIVEKSNKLPSAIFVLAKSLEWITSTTESTKDTLKEKIVDFLSAVRSDSGSSSEIVINPILHLAYVLLANYGTKKEVMLDCFWHSLDFFEQCGCVYYRDLITQWMLEGYFDPVRSVEQAYHDGHSILMDLINCGLLKIQENNVVVPEMSMICLIDPRRRGHFGRSRLAFSRVYGGNKKKGIGKITVIDDIMKTVQAKKGDKITTILVSGDRLRRVTPDKYFKKLKELNVLVLFEPTVETYVKSFSKYLQLLRVLVIRNCDRLESIEELKTLKDLNALEVSGASSLKEISNDFFKDLLHLQSLHLSELQIKSSPSSISELSRLHCLIIKDCPLLEDLPDIQKLTLLEVVDISGARGLKTCFDNTEGTKKNKSKNKNFYQLTKLQLLDFSGSQIERLPIFQDAAEPAKLSSLTRLLLRNCKNLRRLPSLKPLSGLQILDLSGTTSLVEMLEVCFEDKHELKTLNLSGTNLNELATTIEELSGLNELLLRDCINLPAIPNIEKLKNLEVINVSGSTNLKEIGGSFEDMSYLREVNLSGTQVETPKLPKESRIKCVKRIVLKDGRRFEGETWSQIEEDIESESLVISSGISENPSSSDAVIASQEISDETGEIQPVESRVSDRTEMGDARKERLLLVSPEKALYQKILLSVDSGIPQGVMEIDETNKLDEKELANAECVSFVECSPTRLTSIFNETKSVKRCWLRMCTDINDLFSGVNEEHLKSLETLWITNLPSLEKISYVDKFENLKSLSLDCCPIIKTIFPEMPSSLEVLNVKHCEKLEKFVEGVEVSTHTNLKWKVENCPNINKNPSSMEITSSV